MQFSVEQTQDQQVNLQSLFYVWICVKIKPNYAILDTL